MQPKYEIAEIFNSIQGEGPWQGLWVTFIRFAGCNLKCHFCDTDYQSRMTLCETGLVNRIAQESPERIVLTGGEPCLQITESLIKKLHMLDTYPEIAVETNGTVWHDALFRVDHITVSPKPGAPIDPTLKYTTIQELRLLVGMDKAADELLIHIPAQFHKVENVTLSPVFNSHGNVDSFALEKALMLVCKYRERNWRLSVQIHKLIGVQ